MLFLPRGLQMSTTQTIDITIPPSSDEQIVQFNLHIPPTTTPSPGPVPKMLFGTNTLSNDATQGAGMWNNVGHQFTGWYSVGGAIISYDNNGYPQVVSGPASTAQAACWTDLYGYPTGTYILRWKGPSPTSLLIRNKNLTPTGPDSSGYYQANVTFTAGD